MVVMVAVVGLLILMPLARALGARSTEVQEASNTSVGSQYGSVAEEENRET